MKRTSEYYSRFVEVVRGVDGWMSINGFLELCDGHGVFDAEAQAAKVARFKKAEIRRMLRRMGKKHAAQEIGQQIEWVNLIIQTPQGKTQQVYKQLCLFDEGDFVQVVRERMSRVNYWQAEVQRFVDLARVKFGPRIQDMLAFSPPSPE